MRECISCLQKTMTIGETVCPQCSHLQPSTNELKMLRVRLKLALISTAPRRTPNDVPALPRSLLNWLAHINHPLQQNREQREPDVGDEALFSRPSLAQHTMCQLAGSGCIGPLIVARTSRPAFKIPAEEVMSHGAPFALHEHVVKLYHVGEGDDVEAIASCHSPFVVTVVATAVPTSIFVKFSLAKSLRELLQEPQVRAGLRATCPMTLQLLYTVVNALVDLHAHSLVHGHLSSYNVFLSPTEFFQVGVPGTSVTDDALLGWKAPEVLAGDSRPSFASDIYAFGILMTEIDTFQLPFEDDDLEDEVAMTMAVVYGGLRPALRDDCEQWYRDLVDRCVAANPAHRPTATDINELLQGRLDDALARDEPQS